MKQGVRVAPLVLSLFIATMSIIYTPIAMAISDEQKHIFDLGIKYFNYFMDCDSSSGGDLNITNNKNYKGDQILTDDQIKKIKGFQSKYEQAVAGTSIPWQALAAIHIRESNLGEGPQSNGQGPFQDSHYAVGAGCYSDLVCAGKRAVEELKGIVGADADWSNDDTVKKAFFGYNGMAGVYKQQALSLGFDQHGADIGEGSPYVMNRADANRDPSSNPNHWGQIKYDYGGISYPANNDFGAYVYFKALGGGNTSSTSSSSSSSSSTSGKYVWVGDSRTHALVENGIAGSNDTVVAQDGAGLSWFNSTGAAEAASKIDSDTTVVFNMGVNDGANASQADAYATKLNELADGDWSKAKKIIVMSVNPVDDSKSTFINNSQVEAFNNELKSKLNSKIQYLDTYSQLKGGDLGFDSEGVHYNTDTYKKIYQIARGNSSNSNAVCTNSDGSSDDPLTGTWQEKIAKLATQYANASHNASGCYAWGSPSAQSQVEGIISSNFTSPGVDCSGFASTVMYKVTGKWNRRTAAGFQSDNTVFQTVSDGQPGDLIASGGHVGIIVGVNGDGTYQVAESTGFWRNGRGSSSNGCAPDAGPHISSHRNKFGTIKRYVGNGEN